MDFAAQKKGPLGPFFNNGGEGGITQNSLRAVLTLRASPLSRLGAKYSLSRIWSNLRFSSLISMYKQKRPHKRRRFCLYGGEGGIRTLDTRLTYTPLAGERLQPLGHFSTIRRFCAPINERARISQPRRIAISERYKLQVYRRLIGLSGCTPIRSIARNRHALHLSNLREVVGASKML